MGVLIELPQSIEFAKLHSRLMQVKFYRTCNSARSLKDADAQYARARSLDRNGQCCRSMSGIVEVEMHPSTAELKSNLGDKNDDGEDGDIPNFPRIHVFRDHPQAPPMRKRVNGKMRDSREILVGVDGGGTRTRCAAFDRTGKIWAKTETGPSNHLITAGNQALEALADAISSVLRECGAESKHISAVSVGLAGVDVGGEGLLEAREFLHHLGFENCIISADIITAHAGALGGEPGILALSGTGASFFGLTEDGRHLKVGGWGPAYGDEGSAHWIGQMALQSAASAYDGRGTKTLLVESICDALGVQNFSETLQCIYRSQMQVCMIAKLSWATEVAAAVGDSVALGILERAGDELARGVEAVVRTLGYTCPGCQVSWDGAVLRNSAIVRNRFSSSLIGRLPGVSITPPLFDPVYGAYLIGCKTLGWEIAKQ